ncbi:MAG: redoxin domain-containing protein [Sphingobacteriales bacterium]
MLAIVKSPRQFEFDSLELEPVEDRAFRSWYAPKPFRAGDIIPDFIFEKDNFRWQQFHNGVGTNSAVPLRQLLNKTLVLAFYSASWQAHGLDMLKQLNAIQPMIKANDANLLIISSAKNRQFEKLAWDNNLSLSFYFDAENDIAERFGIYSENDPMWNRFSGIDTNVPLLATYVIAPHGRILYDHIESNFAGSFPSEDVVLSVKQ